LAGVFIARLPDYAAAQESIQERIWVRIK